MELQENSITVSPLEILPLEVVEIICKFLSVKDLSSCCATSRRMRDVFGSDLFWRDKCDTELVQYLRETPCRVEPAFTSPENDESTLSPISTWRLDYMRQNHLWNNGKTGQFVEESLTECEVYDFPPRNPFLNEDCVIVQYQDRVEICNVKEFPHEKAAEDIYLAHLESLNWQVIGASEYILIVVQSLILVYKVDLSTKETSFCHAFVLDESAMMENVSDPLVRDEVIFDKLENIIDNYINHIIHQNFFVGVVRRESKLHVWNFHTGEKLIEQECPLDNVSFQNMKCSNKLFLLVKDQRNIKTCLVYDLTTLSFLTFRVSFEGSGGIYVVNDYIAVYTLDPNTGFHQHYVDVYNYETSESVLIHKNIQLPCNSFENDFLFIQNSKLSLFCPSTKTWKSMNTGTVEWFYVASQKFIFLRNNHFFVTVIFKFKELLKEFRWIYHRDIHNLNINKTSTRIFDGSSVLHFW